MTTTRTHRPLSTPFPSIGAWVLSCALVAVSGCAEPVIGGTYLGALEDCEPADLDGQLVSVFVLDEQATIAITDDGIGEACDSQSAVIDPRGGVILANFESTCGELDAVFQATLNFDEDRDTAEGTMVGDISAGDGDFAFVCDVRVSRGE